MKNKKTLFMKILVISLHSHHFSENTSPSIVSHRDVFVVEFCKLPFPVLTETRAAF